MNTARDRGRLGRGGGASRGRGTGGVTGTVACRCPNCGHSQAHRRGVPCTSVLCPRCGTKMRGERCG